MAGVRQDYLISPKTFKHDRESIIGELFDDCSRQIIEGHGDGITGFTFPQAFDQIRDRAVPE